MASCDMDAAATETILEIFCNLDSLSDVFSLSATSWRFRWIWLVHSDYIYRRVGRRSIEGEKHAHALQMAISGNKKVTPNDATTIFHRAEELDCIIEKFDDKVVSKNTCRGSHYSHIKSLVHDSEHLSHSERRRFIRAYYKLYSLIGLDSEQWAQETASLTMKDIYVLHEMCWLPFPIANDLPGPQMRAHFPYYLSYYEEGRRGELAYVLRQRIAAHHRERRNWHMNRCPLAWWSRPKVRLQGYAGFYFLWDEAQESLKGLCLGRLPHYPVKLSEEEMEREEYELWDDSGDEDDDEDDDDEDEEDENDNANDDDDDGLDEDDNLDDF